MIPTIVSGLILMKRRRMMEVFPTHLRKLWKEWELTWAALFSLTLQIVLILSGSRRKNCSGTWVRLVIWFAYMLADSVATVALGILSNDLGQIYDDGGHINVDNELKAFWAPFFLLHLGGPDTITAYSLEDNELYLRHLFWLIVQTTATLYILLLAWTSSNLSYLSIVMILVGCIKYGERTFALWKASRNKLRDSILPPSVVNPGYTKVMEKYAMKLEEGHFAEIKKEKRKEVQADSGVAVPGKTAENEDNLFKAENEDNLVKAHDLNLVKAHDFFQTFKSLFADLVLSHHDRDRSQKEFKEMSDEKAFNVIEIELGFMYDLVYTKAPVIYTPWGFVRRFITFFLTCLVFMFFILDDKLRHNRTDFVVTLLLLLVAIFLEIYAALIVLASDQTRVWLIKHKMTSISSLEEWFKWFKVQRWSNSIAQYSLLLPSLKEKLSLKIIEEFRYKEINDFSAEYRKLIFNHVKEKSEQFEKRREELGNTSSIDTALREFCSRRGQDILHKHKEKIGQVDLEWSQVDLEWSQVDLEWSVSVEFDESILIWHMATEICYYSENRSDDVNLSREFSLQMSRYMLYLLVIYPFMLPVGIGLIRFRDTLAEVVQFFKERMPTTANEGTTGQVWAAALPKPLRKKCSSVVDIEERRKNACESLLRLRTDVPPIKIEGDGSKSVLFDARMLASKLNNISNPKVKWDLMRDMWLELLAYAACHCRGSQHGQQLRRGGELLTHVWLLVAHFGLTEQFQLSQGHPRVMLSTEHKHPLLNCNSGN